MATVYLIPSLLSEGAIAPIPSYVLDAIRTCNTFFTENERTARRFFKLLDKSIIIDDYEWFNIGKSEAEVLGSFNSCLEQNKTIGIVSEAGCPGIADPGQLLIAAAQRGNHIVKPLVGPSSILLALMASGMNGQQFEFCGYLPIDNLARIKRLKELESNSTKQNSTKIFIETPYRNQQLFDSIIQHCGPLTKLCVAMDITGEKELIKTKTIENWRKDKPELPKLPVVFLVYAV